MAAHNQCMVSTSHCHDNAAGRSRRCHDNYPLPTPHHRTIGAGCPREIAVTTRQAGHGGVTTTPPSYNQCRVSTSHCGDNAAGRSRRCHDNCPPPRPPSPLPSHNECRVSTSHCRENVAGRSLMCHNSPIVQSVHGVHVTLP